MLADALTTPQKQALALLFESDTESAWFGPPPGRINPMTAWKLEEMGLARIVHKGDEKWVEITDEGKRFVAGSSLERREMDWSGMPV